VPLVGGGLKGGRRKKTDCSETIYAPESNSSGKTDLKPPPSSCEETFLSWQFSARKKETPSPCEPETSCLSARRSVLLDACLLKGDEKKRKKNYEFSHWGGVGRAYMRVHLCHDFGGEGKNKKGEGG